MDNTILIILMSLAAIAFFYFGYKDDFNRNPGIFIYTVLAVLFLVITFGLANRFNRIAAFAIVAVATGLTLKWKDKAVEKINRVLGKAEKE
jgi:4-amino-4-deoxy-L-arabinose transferase-like glycosyltransferase